MGKKRILFIANHRKGRSPGQRFRFEQYLDYLESNGYEVHFSNIITEEEDKFLYKKGNLLKKAFLALKIWNRRRKDLNRANNFDVIFVFREALLTSSTYFERKFSQSKAKVIFDFDDAIWLPNVSSGNKLLQGLKKPSKTGDIIRHSDMVFAGNQYLLEYASNYSNNIKIIPTTIDTLAYPYIAKEDQDKICIGWSGSLTTIVHFNYVVGALKRIYAKYPDKIYFKIIGDHTYKNEELDLHGDPWKADTEVEDLSEIDIGVMPLPDDEWAKGKCGLKGLQYMALGIPTIMSPVGVNSEIIEDGQNGFLAAEEDEWVEKLSQLIESKSLRLQLGKEGRKTVESKYSVEANKKLYLKHLNELLNS